MASGPGGERGVAGPAPLPPGSSLKASVWGEGVVCPVLFHRLRLSWSPGWESLEDKVSPSEFDGLTLTDVTHIYALHLLLLSGPHVGSHRQD